MSGGRIARVQAFYPTNAAPDPESGYTIVLPAGSFPVRSRFEAAHDAVAVPGAFPLVVFDHGGAGLGADLQRVSQLPVMERMATHGLVVFLALHSNSEAARARDLSLLINHALARSAAAGDILQGSIDPDRIGVSGVSGSGGGPALAVAGGWAAEGLAADSRVKAMVLSEPGLTATMTLDDVAHISVPYLLMRGTQFVEVQSNFAALFAATVAATPRIEVLTPDALHVNYETGVCDIIHAAREQALLANPTIPEPLTTQTAATAPAGVAFMRWNLGAARVGFGSGRNICNRVGVGSVRSLDVSPMDGETDSPPLIRIDPPSAPAAAPLQEVLVERVAHYTIAFWKAFLEGDRRYMRYLTPGYAEVHDFSEQVTILE
jgi:hypothetical protein